MKKTNLNVLAVLAAALVAAGASAQVRPSSEVLADQCADVVLGGLGKGTWVIAEPGPLYESLARRARGRGITVLPTMGGSAQDLRDWSESARKIPNAKVRDSLDLGVAPFVLSWIGNDPAGASSNLVLATLPTLPRAVRAEAVPDGLVFRIVPAAPTDEKELRRLLARYEDARDEFGEALNSVAGALVQQNPARTAYCQLAGLCGNNLGVFCEQAGLREEAWQAFHASDAVYPDGVSALLNLATLAKSGVHAADGSRLAGRLQGLAARRSERWLLALSGGYVLDPSFYVTNGFPWAASGMSFADPGANGLKPLLEKLPNEDARRELFGRLQPAMALQSGAAGPRMQFVAALSEGGWTPELALDASAALFAQGEKLRALALLDKAMKLPGANKTDIAVQKAREQAAMGDAKAANATLMSVYSGPAVTRILGVRLEVAVEVGDLEAAKKAAEEYAARADAPAWAKSAAAALAAQVGGKPDEAAKAIRAGLDAAPVEWTLLRLALMIDLATGQLPDAVSHAESILAVRPFDYFGHYVAAMAASAAGNFAAAEQHYRASIAQRGVWFVINDYASLVANRGDAAFAEALARDALRAGGAEVAAVNDTLGEALFAQKKTDEAIAAFRKATTLPGGADPRIHLHLAEACVAAGDIPGAEKEMPAILAGRQTLNEEELGRLKAVYEACKK